MKVRKSVRGCGPSSPVHKTILYTMQTVVENIEARSTLAVVHLNSFLWTRAVRCGREAQP
jgi:hypothetical protein